MSFYKSHDKNNASQLDGSEPKSKRLNLLIRPSLMNDFKKIAYMRHLSINGLINKLIAEYVSKHAALVEEYDSVFKDMP
ncbi:MAG: hypothetical protein HGB36_13430 [Chlorobiaceae bacterium]|jgi:hypothetical protein|nr:hypothetical protein [Chlorobiaceae bacterium]